MVTIKFKCLDCHNTSEVMKEDEDLSDAAVPFCPKHSKAMKVINIEVKKKEFVRRRAIETIQ